uniref:PCI domain-containing protein n=1 Tax=Ditylenchus dipsaci TaxID=166011 RepID=A0A915D3Y5_9BILA
MERFRAVVWFASGRGAVPGRKLPAYPSLEIARFNLPELASDSAKKLYKLIEVDFNPLKIASNVQNTLEEIATLNRPEYNQYADSIKSAVATKVLKQLTIVYDSLSLKRFSKIIPFYTPIELERFLVDISKHRFIKAQIDHRRKSVFFGPVDATLAGDVENECDVDETENSGLENVRSHVELLYTQLNSVTTELSGEQAYNAALKKLKGHIEVYEYHKDNDYERILMRRKKIENYKENTESLKQEKIQQAQAEQTQKEEKRRAEEIKRLEQENKENEKRRRLAEQEEVQKKIKQDHLRRIQQNPIYQQIIKERGEEVFQNMDPEAVLREQRQRLDAERRDQQTKLQQQEKKFDHNIRAFHLEEMAVRKQVSDARRQVAPELHEAYEEHRIAKAVQDYEKSFVTFERLQKVKSDAVAFLQDVIKQHADDLAAQRKQFKQGLEVAREKRLKERAEKRKAERRANAEKEKERIKQELLRQETERESLRNVERWYKERGSEQRVPYIPPQRDPGQTATGRESSYGGQQQRQSMDTPFDRESMKKPTGQPAPYQPPHIAAANNASDSAPKIRLRRMMTAIGEKRRRTYKWVCPTKTSFKIF